MDFVAAGQQTLGLLFIPSEGGMFGVWRLAPSGDKSVWLDPRTYPGYAAVLSAAILSAHVVWTSKPVQRLRARFTSHTLDSEEEVDPIPEGSFWRRYFEKIGGAIIFVYKFVRLNTVLALLGLVLCTSIKNGWTVFDITMVATLGYTSLLAFLNLVAPKRKGLVYSFHLTLVLLAVVVPYAYRDIWPLTTTTLRPFDEDEGDILWAKVALVLFSSLVGPIFEPYPYIPVDPKDPMPMPSPEQTASLASWFFYTFLDPTIWLAYRVPHLKHEQLPPLCDYDYVKNLIKRAYPRLDPFSGAKKGRLWWGLMVVFRRSLTLQAIVITALAFSKLAGPVGINGLLSHLENDGEGSSIQPWVWIALIILGPLAQNILFQLYIFFSTASLVRTESIITSLVFDHALRIRLKAETANKDATAADDASVRSASTGAGSSTKGTNSPEPVSTDGDDDVEDNTTVHSRSTTAATSASASTTATAVAPAPAASAAKGKETAKKEEKKEDELPKAKGNNLIGKINNLVTSDLEQITEGRDILFLVVSAPVQIILSMGFLYAVLGWSAFVGLVVMTFLFPAPALVSKILNSVQKQKMQATDARVQNVSEMMSVLRMIKLFGWEHRVRDTIADKREAELKFIWKRKMLNLLNNISNHTIPLVHMVVTYATYTMVMRRPLTASIVFSSMSAFNMLRIQMFRVFGMLPMMIQAKVSLGRVADFLRNTELLDQFTEKPADAVIIDSSAEHASDLGMGHANFTWTNEPTDGTVTPSRQTFRLRVEDDLVFRRGKFNLIIGPTGSGKTSLLMALMGELHYIPLGPDSWVNLPRAGGVAYAAQESWVQNETIKENILFGSPYDEERYKKVIYQCGLKRDLSLLEAGDATEVGEKGLTLSGGQKARITLARAVYSPAEILLLDDVLAALDVHTSRWIVDKCFKGDLMRGRTVVLVTHNVAMASPLADFVVSLGTDGLIATQGTVSDALAKNSKLAEEVEIEEKAIELDEVVDEVEGEQEAPAEGKGKLVLAEEIEEGHVSKDAFKLFLGALGGKWPFFFWGQYILGSGLSEVFDSLEMWWLGYWARQYTLHDHSEVSVAYYLGMYTLIVLAVILFHVYAVVVYTYASMRASRSIHWKLISSLLGSTFRWLDVTPTARVITRCTQDIQAVDGEVSQNLEWLSGVTLSMLARLGAVMIFTPTFVLPALAIAAFGGWLGQVYIKAQLSVKREMSTAKAPVLGILGGAIAGLPSIRAYAAQETFKRETMARIDRYVRAARSFYNLNRWISVRIDSLSAIFSGTLAFYLVYGGTTRNPSTIGFVLNMAAGFSEMILWWVRIYNDFEISGNSLERINQYVTIEQEQEPKDGGVPPAHWPSSGQLAVEKLTARYSPDGPKVLQDVSFHINAGERVGIVGRTGSGKSTLTLALLRCIYTEGKVYYDGLPTDSVNLDALRSNITIIPQVPELLSGTLRQNLDMFGQYDDVVLNDALRSAGLFSLQQMSDENRLTLDSQISSGGGNLSVGQRQIIALARAIVRQSKLLVLDEATSAIDYETDAVIQSSLRNELKSDVTVITVAHRLQTIMDSHKIMVLDAGRLVEFDTPKALLKNEKSLLRALVDESADKEILCAMAEGKTVS